MEDPRIRAMGLDHLDLEAAGDGPALQIKIVSHQGAIFHYYRVHRPVLIRGAISIGDQAHTHWGTFNSCCADPLRHNGRSVINSNCITGTASSSDEFTMALPAGTNVYGCSLPKAQAHQAIQAAYGDEGLQALEDHDQHLIDPNLFTSWVELLKGGLQGAGSDALAERVALRMGELLSTQAGSSDGFKTPMSWQHMERLLDLTSNLPPGLNPRVKHLAKALGVSEKQLNRVCQAQVGLPAKDTIEALALSQARRLLRSPELRQLHPLPQDTMAAVAARFGWQKFQNFRARYIHFFGHPPADDFVKLA